MIFKTRKLDLPKDMKTNVGSLDRTIRILLGLAILAAGFYYQNWFGLIGIVPLAYLPFGLSTCRKE